MDKGLAQADLIVLPLGAPRDLFLLHNEERVPQGNGRRLTLLHTAGLMQRNPSFRNGVQRLQELASNRIEVLTGRGLDAQLLAEHDVLVSSYKGWSRAAEARKPWLEAVPSALIIRP
ncbi:MAG: hypothetical protein IPM12_06965 [Flavobacteriales bacterium]|nr:hypothetical protein [Flavobacteriales bacterium]